MDWGPKPTPTLEEYFWSHFNLMSYDDLEDVLYKTIDMYLLFGPIVAKAVYNRVIGGMAWNAAGYAASQNSWGLARFMTKPGRLVGFVKKHPVVLALAGLMAIRPDEIDTPDWEYERIARARQMSMGGGYTGTHPYLQEPYLDNPAGERIYYSFHPEWI